MGGSAWANGPCWTRRRGASAVLRVDGPGAIHSVVLNQGPYAFDDFTFDGLAPAPGGAALLAFAGMASLRRRR